MSDRRPFFFEVATNPETLAVDVVVAECDKRAKRESEAIKLEMDRAMTVVDYVLHGGALSLTKQDYLSEDEAVRVIGTAVIEEVLQHGFMPVMNGEKFMGLVKKHGH